MRLEKILRWWLIFVIFVSAILVVTTAEAQSNHHNKDSDVDVDASSVVETVIGGDDSLGIGIGLAYGMGDVDINEGQNCMGSEQKANIIWGSQELALNPWCAALFYELNGQHTFAAKMRCDIPEISKHYQTAEACVLDQDLSPPAVTSDEREAIDQHVEVEEQHTEELQQVQTAQASIVGRLDYLTQQLEEIPPQLEEPAAQPQQWSAQPEYTDEQVDAVWAALSKGDENE